MIRKVLATAALVAALIAVPATASAAPPDDKPPPDRGHRVPACTLGVDLGGQQICIIP